MRGESAKLTELIYWLMMKTDTSWAQFPRALDAAACVIYRYKSGRCCFQPNRLLTRAVIVNQSDTEGERR